MDEIIENLKTLSEAYYSTMDAIHGAALHIHVWKELEDLINKMLELEDPLVQGLRHLEYERDE